MELILEDHEVKTLIDVLKPYIVLKPLTNKIKKQRRGERYKLKASHALYKDNFTRERYERWKNIMSRVIDCIDPFWMTWTFIAERKLGDMPIEFSEVCRICNKYEKLEDAVYKYIKENIEPSVIHVRSISEDDKVQETICVFYEYILHGCNSEDHCKIPVKDLVF